MPRKRHTPTPHTQKFVIRLSFVIPRSEESLFGLDAGTKIPRSTRKDKKNDGTLGRPNCALGDWDFLAGIDGNRQAISLSY
jgi:hypothetical protein